MSKESWTEEQLNQLPLRQKEIIRLRTGLYDGREWTLIEVGKRFNISRERTRQIEARALAKLRYLIRSRRLLPITEDRNREMKDYLFFLAMCALTTAGIVYCLLNDYPLFACVFAFMLGRGIGREESHRWFWQMLRENFGSSEEKR